MAEYIDRITIVQKIKNRYLPRSVDPYNVNLYDAGVNCGLDLALGLIESAISEDVVPVVHGKWIYKGVKGRFPVCECSVCGNAENADWAILGDNVNFCPNCGARMDGEDDG